jgi:hypothetical protein
VGVGSTCSARLHYEMYADPLRIVKHILQRFLRLSPHSGNVRLMATKAEIREYFAKFGRRGGKAYAKNTSPEQRKAAARRAAQARWAREKAKPKEIVRNITDSTVAREERSKGSKSSKRSKGNS